MKKVRPAVAKGAIVVSLLAGSAAAVEGAPPAVKSVLASIKLDELVGVQDVAWHWTPVPHWAVYFDKESTRLVADHGWGWAGILAAACTAVGGPAGGVACAAQYALFTSVAVEAQRNKECLVVRYSPFAPAAWATKHDGSGCV